MRGTLWLLTPEEFGEYHSRFYDISPSSPPRLSDKDCEPWALIHSILGVTWCDRRQLPSGQTPYLPPHLEEWGANQPTFIALTDSADLFRHSEGLGTLGLDLKYTPTLVFPGAGTPNDLIIALSSNTPFKGLRSLKFHKGSAKYVTDYPPLPISPSLHQLVRDIWNQSQNSHGGIPKKSWIATHLKAHLWMKPINRATGILSPRSPLFAHRSNEAMLPHNVWRQLCEGPSLEPDNRPPFDTTMPEGYWQMVFPDLQARERYEGGGFVLRSLDLDLFAGNREPMVDLVEAGVVEVDVEGCEGQEITLWKIAPVRVKDAQGLARQDSVVDEKMLDCGFV